MFDDRHDGPELHVPAEALERPQGAAVASDGTVACVSCGNRVPLASADIVGQGYRCAPCSHRAHLANLEHGRTVDAGAHLSRGVRDDLMRTGRAMIWGGLGVTAVGVLIVIASLKEGYGIRLGGIVVAAGAALMITGSLNKQAAGG